ncbi:MAG TPA: adenylate/guanylate cyclase domain-containing protein, partial [Chloroflexia bacterium]|nr:adenylate/guanylate cyclase domain-containing protein [Chloroflexia bacterium]
MSLERTSPLRVPLRTGTDIHILDTGEPMPDLANQVRPPLPSGTVTFLFTDIEGSTRLWEQFPQTMGVALARHDAIVRGAIQVHGGVIFNTAGDAFHTVFNDVLSAVAAAIQAQQQLQAESWNLPDDTSSTMPAAALRVRMGLHTGPAEMRNGHYFGPSLNRVARIMSIGHGGQILLSAPAREALGSQVPVGTHLLDLGEQQLKDVVRPERVFQLVPEGLASTFPPLRALPAFQHNLPIPLTSFIGRAREMAEAAQLLGTTRLLTLVGPGGTGKTRLSLQVATDQLENFPQGVWFVELAPLTDAARLAQAVALALSVHEEPGRPLLPTLIESLGTRRLLMVLDNCEHLLAACSELASAILSACPEVCIL